MPNNLKRALLGNPIDNAEAAHQRLSNLVALPVFASDALSSVAYATEEILLVLILAGSAALSLSLPIGLAIAVLIAIVVASYRQTIRAYPSGGGSYIVAKQNLGANWGLIAGASLLVDYILTVAVSISAGTAAITSAFPQLLPYTVEIAVVLVILLAYANLRGVRESGAIFAAPTYFFIGMLSLLIVTGLFKLLTGTTIEVNHVVTPAMAEQFRTLGILLVLRAFSSGCTAMTGIEAVANGVQAFKAPESHNANLTLTTMASILVFMFLGTTYLAWATHLVPVVNQTTVSDLAAGVWGRGILYYMLQAGTAAILVLAANTSYADFPRLASFMASDSYLPKQLRLRGARLVFSNGLILLTFMALILIIVFKGVTSALIPLYAVGVFLSFTLSQSGMVVHWWRLRETDDSWRHSLPLNLLGAIATGIVTIVIAVSKFTSGAWVVVLLIPVLVAYFLWVHKQYSDDEAKLALPEGAKPLAGLPDGAKLHNHVDLLVSRVDKRIPRAVQYVKALNPDSAEAVYVDMTGDGAEEVTRQWDSMDFGIPLTIVESPYRELIEPLTAHVKRSLQQEEIDIVTVVLPEFVPDSPLDYMLHDQTPLLIKSALCNLPRVVVADVPYHLARPQDEGVTEHGAAGRQSRPKTAEETPEPPATSGE
jgi:amino acid transporter